MAAEYLVQGVPMFRRIWKHKDPARPFLSRLRHDVRGNTLAIMAAAMVPLIGFAGSAIDMGRLYVVKVRLQQACDAGVLAGRKTMTDTSPTTPLDSTASAQAQSFFANNFKAGFYSTTAVSFTPTKAVNGTDSTVANAVTGSATATVPMTLMAFFGQPALKLTVACQAVFDLADTDVMFVLDTTGSMSCQPSDPANCANGVVSYTRGDGTTGYYNQESSNSKIEALRQAVLLFDSTMRSSADPTTHFRYGFVTYSSAVNVGGIIPSNYLQNTSWTYQSRHVQADYNYGAASSVSLTNVPKSFCVAQRSPATGYARTGLTWTDQGYYQARNYYNVSWTSANGGTCSGTQQPLRALWRYEPTALDTSGLVSSLSTGTAVVNPTKLDGSTSTWRGCIEELDTTTGSSFDVGNLPDDLDPDVIPTTTTNKWRPRWPEAEWLRNTIGAQDVKDDAIVEDNTSAYYNLNYRPGGYLDKLGSSACGMPAKRLQVWTAQQVHDYVYNVDFKPFGGTYHDVGMIWGTRMLSPTGVFASDTAAWPGRKEPTRNIVFMTDGTMSPSQTSYGQYGVELWDNRTGGSNNSTTDYNNHTARFRVECDAAKKRGFTIYVVAVGTGVTNDLTYCASPGQTFQASSTDELTKAFKSIAQRIAQLRITQ